MRLRITLLFASLFLLQAAIAAPSGSDECTRCVNARECSVAQQTCMKQCSGYSADHSDECAQSCSNQASACAKEAEHACCAITEESDDPLTSRPLEE
jgi:hypothetical protein